jgi:hypothetical protein
MADAHKNVRFGKPCKGIHRRYYRYGWSATCTMIGKNNTIQISRHNWNTVPLQGKLKLTAVSVVNPASVTLLHSFICNCSSSSAQFLLNFSNATSSSWNIKKNELINGNLFTYYLPLLILEQHMASTELWLIIGTIFFSFWHPKWLIL